MATTQMAMATTQSHLQWTLPQDGNNLILEVTMNQDQEGAQWMVIDKINKKKWKSERIGEREASKITNGLYDDSREALVDFVKEGLNNKRDNRTTEVQLSLNLLPKDESSDRGMEMEMVVRVKERHALREFILPLAAQAMQPWEPLGMMLDDQKDLVQQLQEQVTELQEKVEELTTKISKKGKKSVLIADHPGTISNPTAATDVCKITLPAGKWLVQYTFYYLVTEENQLCWDLMYGTSNVDGTKGCFVYESTNPNETSPRPMNGMVVVNSNGKDQVYLRFSPHKSKPTFKNIIIAAHPLPKSQQ